MSIFVLNILLSEIFRWKMSTNEEEKTILLVLFRTLWVHKSQWGSQHLSYVTEFIGELQYIVLLDCSTK